MTAEELRRLLELLRKLEQVDFGDCPAYSLGDWSRSNLRGVILDLEVMCCMRFAEQNETVLE